MNICQHVHITFALPNYWCHVTPFQFQYLASEVIWHPLCFGLTVLQQFIFYFVKSLYKSGEEKKLLIYIICLYPLLFLPVVLVWHGLSFLKGHIICLPVCKNISMSCAYPVVSQLVYLILKHICFFGIYCSNDPSCL